MIRTLFISFTVFIISGCQLGTLLDSSQGEVPTAVATAADQPLAVEASAASQEAASQDGAAGGSEDESVLRVGDLLAATPTPEPNDLATPDVAATADDVVAPTEGAETNQTPSSASSAVDNSTANASETDSGTDSGTNPGTAPGTNFEMGNELTIATLQAREIVGSEIVFEQTLDSGANYARYIASYLSEGYRVYGLLTVPLGEPPAGGYKAVVFNHGFIPPSVYRTTERYVAYVDALARSELVVFKIDLRGHGNSEGEPSGTYFSPTYTVDAISALKSLQTLDFVDPQGIGMWGHSMAGNLVLRSMLIEPEVKAGVIWAGAVYSYDDFALYEIDDPSATEEFFRQSPAFRRGREIREFYGPPDTSVPYWQAVSLTKNLGTLQAPLQLHHAANDDVVNIGYSVDLAAVLSSENKRHELYQYEGGGHNISSPYFSEAMQRTIAFFLANL